MTYNLSNFRKADIRPKGPSAPEGYVQTFGDDETRYLQVPDREFYRPWMATPGGSAFVWPGGIEGFNISGNATTGIHHYIGDIHTDVQVVYPDELHITLNGQFMGRTSIKNMHALRSVILQESTEPGKILALPGVENNMLFVQVLNHSFTHSQDDRTRTVAYSIEFIKTQTGAQLNPSPLLPHVNSPVITVKPRGKSQSRVGVKQGKQTARSVAQKSYGTFEGGFILNLIRKNEEEIEKAGIALYKVPQIKLPLGLKLNI